MLSRNRDPLCREHFGSAEAKQALQAAGLDTFEAIWTLSSDWIEEPNLRRSGWSGVSRVTLPVWGRKHAALYVKRQQGHCFRAFRHGFLSRPTAYREYLLLLRLKARGVAVPEVTYYGERRSATRPQAILITREVPHSLTFDEYLRNADGRAHQEVDTVIRDTALLVRSLHRLHMQHSALYGKHILIANAGEPCPGGMCADRRVVPYLIDLENSRFRISRNAIAVHDLSQLFRHTPWRSAHWEAFLRHYRDAGEMRMTREALKSRVAQKVCAKAAGQRRSAV